MDLNMFLESVEEDTLVEAVDLSNAYDWERRSEAEYTFKNDSKQTMSVVFSTVGTPAMRMYSSYNLYDATVYSVDFDIKGGDFDLTGLGSAIKVLTTVLNIVVSFIDGSDNIAIEFSTLKELGEPKEGESKRFRLYKKFIDRALRDIPELKSWKTKQFGEDNLLIYDSEKNPDMDKPFVKKKKLRRIPLQF